MDKLQPLFERPKNIPFPALSSEIPTHLNCRQPFNRNANGRGKYFNPKLNERSINQYYPNKKFTSTYGGKELHFPEKLTQYSKIPRVELDDAKRIAALEQDRNARYKTEICRNFKERSTCIYGNQCQFAHGKQELRDSMKSNKYKTKFCDKYWGTGYCAYGPRCNYLHYEADEENGTKLLQRYGDNSLNEKQVNENTISMEKFEFASDKSDSNLAETVEGILDQMEKEKLRCDPKLEDLFLKLKRALPSKNNPRSPDASGDNQRPIATIHQY